MRVVRSPKARLGLFLGVLLLLSLGVLALSPVSEDGLRDALEPLGIAAPLGFVLVAALLATAFVPGPVLAGASGLLFGTLTGFAVTLASAVLTSVLALLAARRAGRAGMEELEQPRVKQVEALVRRYGVGAVIVQRLVPGIPDTPCSYLYGLLGLRVVTVALGTLVGAAPRAFSYTAVGDGLGGGGTTIGVIGGVGLAVTAVVGLAAGAVLARRVRADRG